MYLLILFWIRHEPHTPTPNKQMLPSFFLAISNVDCREFINNKTENCCTFCQFCWLSFFRKSQFSIALLKFETLHFTPFLNLVKPIAKYMYYCLFEHFTSLPVSLALYSIVVCMCASVSLLFFSYSSLLVRPL